jgi:uncharacterized protein (DUF849 family)/N-acetylglutamate synthase-like GNAT family acetyltransferase
VDPAFTIEQAKPEDRAAILDVMRPYGMHRVPSPEMEDIDLNCFYVARVDGAIVGAAGYKVISQTVGKTTLLGVLPEYSRHGVGSALQDARVRAMAQIGVKRIVTNADRPRTIRWYKRKYGYREIGKLKKIADFGDPNVDHWTTLEMDVAQWLRRADRAETERQYVLRHEPHPLAPYPPLLINAALTGMLPTKQDTPHVPVTAEQVVADAQRVTTLGVQIVHVHARDDDGKPTWKASVYEKIVTGIRQTCPGVIVCVSTSGRNWPEFERRSECLMLDGGAKPDMASLTLGSLNFPTGASVNEPDMIERLAQTMHDRGIKPELEVFEPGMIGFAKYLERGGVIEGRKYFNLLLGNLGTMPATIGDLSQLVASLPDESTWAATGVGVFQLPINVAAIIAGGGVRVGLEDSIHFDYDRAVAASNAQLVERLVRIADECQRPLATTRQARTMVGLG